MKEIKVESLEKQYKGRKVVKGVSLKVSEGEVIGLLGPNGAGKTTTFYMIVGLVGPNAGTERFLADRFSDLPQCSDTPVLMQWTNLVHLLVTAQICRPDALTRPKLTQH